MKVTGYRKYILILIFLLVGYTIYLRSTRWDKEDRFYSFMEVLVGAGIIGSVASKATDKFGKNKDIEP